MKDTHAVQMLSTKVALKGRSLPIYREVFEEKQLKNQAPKFIEHLSSCIPQDREVLIIMDAGFGEDWSDARELYSIATTRVKHCDDAYITKKSPRHRCAIINRQLPTTPAAKKPKNLPKNYNSANGNYLRSAKEPWILATNLPAHYTPSNIVNAYKKRMQIEESFRDVKSHQFGLSVRYIRIVSIYRWSIAMLLSAIVQVMLWMIGVIGHHQGMQAYFQVNTVRDKKLFSYFYLGQLIVQYNMLDEVMLRCDDVLKAIEEELARDW